MLKGELICKFDHETVNEGEVLMHFKERHMKEFQ